MNTTRFVIFIAYIMLNYTVVHGLYAAFIYPTPISDFAYSYSHETARVTVEKYYLSRGSFQRSIEHGCTYCFLFGPKLIRCCLQLYICF